MWNINNWIILFYEPKIPWNCPTVRFTIFTISENEGKSVQLQYNDRLELIALTQQAHHGKLIEDNLSPLGALDVIGKDRR